VDLENHRDITVPFGRLGKGRPPLIPRTKKAWTEHFAIAAFHVLAADGPGLDHRDLLHERNSGFASSPIVGIALDKR
jgi:hypothetical protein